MKIVNVTALRAQLSQVLESVRQGEEVEIHHRQIPIARLVPIVPGTEGRKGKLPPWLERLRRTGAIRVGTLRPVAEILKGFPPGTRSLGTAAVDAILDERRSER